MTLSFEGIPKAPDWVPSVRYDEKDLAFRLAWGIDPKPLGELALTDSLAIVVERPSGIVVGLEGYADIRQWPNSRAPRWLSEVKLGSFALPLHDFGPEGARIETDWNSHVAFDAHAGVAWSQSDAQASEVRMVCENVALAVSDSGTFVGIAVTGILLGGASWSIFRRRRQ